MSAKHKKPTKKDCSFSVGSRMFKRQRPAVSRQGNLLDQPWAEFVEPYANRQLSPAG